MKHDDLIVVYTLHDPIRAEIIRNELTANGVACELSGQNFSDQWPGSPLQEVQVLVKAEDAGKARKLIEKHEK
jgi:hypothetical protein